MSLVPHSFGQAGYTIAPETIYPVQFDLVEVVRLLWRAKWRVAACTALGLAAALAVAFSLPQSYVAQGEVVVRAEASVAPDADRAFNATAVNEAVVATERSVLDAEGLLTRAAHEVAFPPELLRPSWLTVRVEQVRAALSEQGIGRAPAAPTPADEDAKRLALLRTAIGTSVEKGSSVIAVMASTTDPAFSASVVNHLLDDYMEDRVASQRAVARNVEVALQERLRQVTEQVRAAQDRIAHLMQQPNLIENSEIPQAQRNISILSSQLSQARHDQVEKQAAYDAAVRARTDARGDPARLGELLDNGSQASADARRLFAQKQQELAGMSAQFGANYPPRIAAQNEVNVLASRLSGEAARIVAQRKAELDAANKLVASLTTEYNGVRSDTSSFSIAALLLSRERDSLANLQRLSGTIEDRLIAVASQPVDPNARILTRAIAPRAASFPNKPLLGVVGMLVGFIGSSAAIVAGGFVRRARPTVMRHAELLAGPLLGSIPKLGRVGKRNEGLVEALRRVQADGSQAVNSAFQGAALELDDAIRRLDARVVTIASALPQEGKSTMAVVMGRNLAKLGRRVLLVQCDLHEGRVRYFARRRGTGPEVLPDVVHDAAESFSVLELPTARQPMDFLCSAGFRDILDRARRDFDVVLCDVPPVLSVPDPLVVARLSDAVLLVREFKREAAHDETTELARRIAATAKPVCGVIVTKVDSVDIGYSAYLGYKPAARRNIAFSG